MENCARRAQNCARVALQYFTSSACNDVAIWKVDDLFVRIGKASEFAAIWIVHHLSVPHWCAFTLDIDISNSPDTPKYTKPDAQTTNQPLQSQDANSSWKAAITGRHSSGILERMGMFQGLRRRRMSTTIDIYIITYGQSWRHFYYLNLCSDSLMPRTQS